MEFRSLEAAKRDAGTEFLGKKNYELATSVAIFLVQMDLQLASQEATFKGSKKFHIKN